MTVAYNVNLRNAQLNAVTTQVGNAGTLTIYNGTQPANGGTATTALATFILASPFGPAAASGVLSPTLPSSTTGLATGTATWFRISTSGATQVIDGTVGTSGADLNLNTTSIVSGTTVSLSAWTITAGNP